MYRRVVKKRNPNVQSKRLWSEIMHRFIHFRVTTRVLKTIDKYGGKWLHTTRQYQKIKFLIFLKSNSQPVG